MQIVAPREGQDHDISLPGAAAFGVALFIAALTAAFPAQPAWAQGGVPCTAIANDAERLACYDRALRGAPPAPQAPAAQASPPPAAPARAAAPAAEAAAEEPRRERRIRESAAPAAAAAAAAPAAPVAGRNDDEQIVPVVIVGVRALPGRETTFTAEDGASWVQTDSQRIVGLPDTPFDAELKSGAMGSWFLVPKDRARAIRVRPASR
jgi:hypothetical protein